ncbi:hypothetical protein DL96DRAFT_1587316 [Flagelloscypha sp. PMI_526]|nr:hypothetical protein DL96DRAFT_1587316 [Flagelloscypha sp. PMI_526]
MVTLHEDLFAVVLAHIHDCPSLERLFAICEGASRQRTLIVQRLASPSYTSHLFNLLLDQTKCSYINHIDIDSGPSRVELLAKEWDYREELLRVDTSLPLPCQDDYQGQDSTSLPQREGLIARATFAHKLLHALPLLLLRCQNLRSISWRRSPWPSPAIFEALASLPLFQEIRIDCVTVEEKEFTEPDEYWEDFPTLFTSRSFATHIRCLRLIRVAEPNYLQLQPGTPPGCPLDSYEFKPLMFHEDAPMGEFRLLTADGTLCDAIGGPLRMVEGAKISKLVVQIQCAWAIRAFKALDIAYSLPNLSHFVVTEDPEPKLWLHRYILHPPELLDPGDWNADLLRLIPFSELWETREWKAIEPTLKRLEGLRLGFGPVDEIVLRYVLDKCNPELLEQFGFEWDWGIYP